ncbi:hypothetical protein [Halorientalis marina]|uniref:hypothetical protein n=1 Tax=Halorientalis marina TaxID=2931976 RepID=UPI001FF15925|nr:hypothetical protein [Halorientalis marina]
MTGDRFPHAPTESREIDPNAPTSFDEAKEHVEDGDAEGLGFVVNRHDPFLVVEIANALEGDELAEPVERILSSLGMTFTEKEDDETIRLMYEGALPGDLHGGDPVGVVVSGEETNYAFRLYDNGWTPLTGNHIPGTPEGVEDIDANALKSFLAKSGKLD